MIMIGFDQALLWLRQWELGKAVAPATVRGMHRRVLGKTALSLPLLSFSLSAGDEQAMADTLRLALEQGFNCFDAPIQVQELLGRNLAGVQRETYLLSTRWAVNEGDLLAAIDESLGRLDVQHIDLLTIQDVEHADPGQVLRTLLPAAQRLKAQGKVRFIGIQSYSFGPLGQILDQAGVDFVVSSARYTPQDTSLAQFLPYLQVREVGVINADPFASGLFAQSPPPPGHPAPKEVIDACARAAELCRRREGDLSKLALQFAASLPAITTTLVEVSSPQEVRTYLEWIEQPVDLKLFTDVRRVLLPAWNVSWACGREQKQ